MNGYRLDENLSGFFGKPVWIDTKDTESICQALFTKEAIYVSSISNYEIAEHGDALINRKFSESHHVFDSEKVGKCLSPWNLIEGIPVGDTTLWLVLDCWSQI